MAEISVDQCQGRAHRVPLATYGVIDGEQPKIHHCKIPRQAADRQRLSKVGQEALHRCNPCRQVAESVLADHRCPFRLGPNSLGHRGRVCKFLYVFKTDPQGPMRRHQGTGRSAFTPLPARPLAWRAHTKGAAAGSRNSSHDSTPSLPLLVGYPPPWLMPSAWCARPGYRIAEDCAPDT